MLVRELRHPIVLAPLAGGPSTPPLAAAVCEAGGLGFLAAGYLTADALRADIHALRELTAAPFGVNVFVPGSPDVDEEAVCRYVERLREREGVEPGEPRFDDDDWDAKLRVLAAEKPRVVSFTFGCPSREVISSLAAAGSEVWVTVTDLAEARIAHAAGADALVLQGSEAGGHRASFVDCVGAEQLGILALTRLVVSAIDLPLIATGGLGDRPAVAAVLAAGAGAAQLGTAFLRAPEAGTNAAHKAALATETPTALTRAFTGRLARGLVNRFLLEHDAAAPIRAAARAAGDADGFNLWAGQAHALAEELPAAEILSRFTGSRATTGARSRGRASSRTRSSS